MLIAIINNETVEKVGNYRELFPHVSFPSSGPDSEWLENNSCLPVNLFKNHDARTQKLVPVDPYIEDGWVYTIDVEDKTEEELAIDAESQWAKIRALRNTKLQQSDWVVTKALETGEAIPTEWLERRQALRDITTQEDPFDITWPDESSLS